MFLSSANVRKQLRPHHDGSKNPAHRAAVCWLCVLFVREARDRS